jgi:large subunit ribosomal protein L18
MKTVARKECRERRHKRIRQAVSGTPERPRLCVMVSNQHIYVQLVDDEKGSTLITVSSCGKNPVGGKSVAGAKELGRRIAELAKDEGIQGVVFDRGGYQYHGRVKAVADAAREAGLKF